MEREDTREKEKSKKKCEKPKSFLSKGA